MTAPLLSQVVEAGRGLPWMQFRLFMELVARADWTTGIVGESPRLSYQALREALYVEPSQGRSPERKITKPLLRSALRTLERWGLIESRGELVFRVLCLSQDYSVQNNLSTICTPIRAHQESEKDNERPQLRVVHGNKNTHTNQKSEHTSVDDDFDDDGGFDTQSTDHLRDRLTSAQLARQFVNSRGFNPTTLTPECMASFREWERLGVTQGVFLHVVELVDARLARKGLDRPNSPRYYHQEMIKALSNADSRRAGEAGNH